MVAKQLSIFLENKSGRLTEVTEVLAKENMPVKISTFLPCASPKMLILAFCVELYPIRIKHIKH